MSVSITDIDQIDELYLVQHHLKPDKHPHIDPDTLTRPETIERVKNALTFNVLIEDSPSTWRHTAAPENLEDMSGKFVDQKTYMDYASKVVIHNEDYIRRELILAYILLAVRKTQPDWETSWITINWEEVVTFLKKMTGLDRYFHNWEEAVSLNHEYICWRLYSPLYPNVSFSWDNISFPYIESFIIDVGYTIARAIWKRQLVKMAELVPRRLRNSSEPYIRVSMNMSELRSYLYLSRDYRTKVAFLSKACRKRPFNDSISRWTRSWNFEPKLLGMITAFLPCGRKDIQSNPVFPLHFPDLEPDTYVLDDNDIPDGESPTMRWSSDDVTDSIESIFNNESGDSAHLFDYFFLKWCSIKYSNANYYDSESSLVTSSEIKSQPTSFKNNAKRYHVGDFWEDPISKLGRITYFSEEDGELIEFNDCTRVEHEGDPLLVDFYGPVSVMGPFMDYYKKLSRPDYRLDPLYSFIYPNYEEMITACHTSSKKTPRFTHECACDGDCTCASYPFEWIEVYPSG